MHDVAEKTGKVFSVDAFVLVVNSKDSTADALSRDFVLEYDILSVFSGEDHIGYATLMDGCTFRLFIDYSTPERLELENGEKKYLVARGERRTDMFYIDHLELVSEELEGDAIPVGSSDLLFK